MAVCEKFTAFQLIERAMAVIPIERGRLATSVSEKGPLRKTESQLALRKVISRSFSTV
jgi:hypothetical protein